MFICKADVLFSHLVRNELFLKYSPNLPTFTFSTFLPPFPLSFIHCPSFLPFFNSSIIFSSLFDFSFFFFVFLSPLAMSLNNELKNRISKTILQRHKGNKRI